MLAKFLQHRLTQKLGIELTSFRKLDDFFGDSFIDYIALGAKLKSCASHFECHAHDPLGFRVEFGTVQKLRDGHHLLPLSAMALYADPACQSGDGLRRYSSMTIPQAIAVSLIVAVCAAATGRLASSVIEFVYWVL